MQLLHTSDSQMLLGRFKSPLSPPRQRWHPSSVQLFLVWNFVGHFSYLSCFINLRQVFKVPLSLTRAWTDSTIVLNWLDDSPRRFKAYVGNHVSTIIDLIPPNRWHHVNGCENPADCGSRGLFPSELLNHNLWWEGPIWLRLSPDYWPQQSILPPSNNTEQEERSHVQQSL